MTPRQRSQQKGPRRLYLTRGPTRCTVCGETMPRGTEYVWHREPGPVLCTPRTYHKPEDCPNQEKVA